MKKTPKIFHVNWFRTDPNGKFLWPGYGENLRILEWILDRCNNKVGAAETPIGYVPNLEDIDMTGLDLPHGVMEKLFAIEPKDWLAELSGIKEFFKLFKKDLPGELWEELKELEIRLKK
jgi:phosphoenolpyruvate carboxykinase (GTP)